MLIHSVAEQNKSSRTTARQLQSLRGGQKKLKHEGPSGFYIVFSSMLLNILGREVPQTNANQRKSCYQQWIVRTAVNTMPGEEVLSDEVPFCGCPLYSAYFVKMRDEFFEMGERNCCLPCKNSEQVLS